MPEKADRSTPGSWIRARRGQLGLTRDELAAALGIGVATVDRYQALGGPRWVRLAMERLQEKRKR